MQFISNLCTSLHGIIISPRGIITKVGEKRSLQRKKLFIKKLTYIVIIFFPLLSLASFSFSRIFSPAFCLSVGMQRKYLTRTRYATTVCSVRTCRASSERALGIAKRTLLHRRGRHGFRCRPWRRGKNACLRCI